jgi:hypothetical protein
MMLCYIKTLKKVITIMPAPTYNNFIQILCVRMLRELKDEGSHNYILVKGVCNAKENSLTNKKRI